jgi:NADPH:quinone reductase-like Zn-dependent oxidoreductase
MPIKTMKSWQLEKFGLASLRLTDAAMPQPGPRELLVRVTAISLNYRDKLIIEGGMLPDLKFPFLPASDAVGEVVAVGDQVSRFRSGDRVVSHFQTAWLDGVAPPGKAYTRTLGGPLPGVLAEYILLQEDAAVAPPPSLNDAEAATLPIAALTPWFALFEAAKLTPGQTVVVQGTGGVSIFAIQLASTAGARVIVTSSSDDKLARAKKLGASDGINYARQPDWDEAVKALTAERGADHVLEIAGGDNLRRSLNALASGGRISLIGLLQGLEFTLGVIPFMLKRATLEGILVGHRRAFEAMNAAIEANRLKPVIDAVYPFADAHRAFAHLDRGPFGKVVIEVR